MILSIISEQVIETQEDLVAALCDRGLPVTQATVSRDIKELRLVKVATDDGRYRYALQPGTSEPGIDVTERAQRAFDEYVTSIEYTGNLIVVKTLPGSAPVVAASIDALEIDGVVGTIAGDDAILVVTKHADPEPPPAGPTAAVYDRLLELARRHR